MMPSKSGKGFYNQAIWCCKSNGSSLQEYVIGYYVPNKSACCGWFLLLCVRSSLISWPHRLNWSNWQAKNGQEAIEKVTQLRPRYSNYGPGNARSWWFCRPLLHNEWVSYSRNNAYSGRIKTWRIWQWQLFSMVRLISNSKTIGEYKPGHGKDKRKNLIRKVI